MREEATTREENSDREGIINVILGRSPQAQKIIKQLWRLRAVMLFYVIHRGCSWGNVTSVVDHIALQYWIKMPRDSITEADGILAVMVIYVLGSESKVETCGRSTTKGASKEESSVTEEL